jgi:hypothetical protein
MPRRIFDSNKLMTQLRRLASDAKPLDAERLAEELIDLFKTNAIVTPVEIEVLAGVRDARELELTESFLRRFDVIDKRNIPANVWEDAKRIAKRVVKYDREVPRSQRKRRREVNPKTPARHLGDCLIMALANHFQCEIVTDDKGISKQAGRAGRG